jgi:hypothetical protein
MRRIALTVLLLAAAAAIADEATSADLKALSGTWVAVSGEADGKEIPKAELAVQWTFKDGGKAVFAHREPDHCTRWNELRRITAIG